MYSFKTRLADEFTNDKWEDWFKSLHSVTFTDPFLYSYHLTQKCYETKNNHCLKFSKTREQIIKDDQCLKDNILLIDPKQLHLQIICRQSYVQFPEEYKKISTDISMLLLQGMKYPNFTWNRESSTQRINCWFQLFYNYILPPNKPFRS